jgi:transposase
MIYFDSCFIKGSPIDCRLLFKIPNFGRFAKADHHLLLTQAQFSRLQPLLPNKPRGVPRLDDRRVISAMVHVIRNGLMWRDAHAADGRHKALYNRFVLWRRVGVFDRIFATLATERAATNTVMMEPSPPPNTPHRTAASLRKMRLFFSASGGPKEARPPSCTRVAMWTASH